MNAEFDFIIVGSGVLGCLAYDYFASRDNKILLISEDIVTDDNKFNIQTGAKIYSGIVIGRKKGLGGTSQLWGGAMNVNFDKKFIKQCQLENINFDIEKQKVLDFSA